MNLRKHKIKKILESRKYDEKLPNEYIEAKLFLDELEKLKADLDEKHNGYRKNMNIGILAMTPRINVTKLPEYIEKANSTDQILTRFIERNIDITTIVDKKTNTSLGIQCAELNLTNATLRAMENPKALKQTNRLGWDMGIIGANHHNPQIVESYFKKDVDFTKTVHGTIVNLNEIYYTRTDFKKQLNPCDQRLFDLAFETFTIDSFIGLTLRHPNTVKIGMDNVRDLVDKNVITLNDETIEEKITAIKSIVKTSLFDDTFETDSHSKDIFNDKNSVDINKDLIENEGMDTDN